jgi:hypothetical protein
VQVPLGYSKGAPGKPQDENVEKRAAMKGTGSVKEGIFIGLHPLCNGMAFLRIKAAIDARFTHYTGDERDYCTHQLTPNVMVYAVICNGDGGTIVAHK